MSDPTFTFINWQGGQEITSTALNEMIDNDDYLNNQKLDGALRNIDPSTGLIVSGSELITSDLTVIGGYLEFIPPSQYDPDGDVAPSVTDRFILDVNFPAGAFNPAYQPIVITHCGSHTGSLVKVMSTVRFVTAEMFEVTVSESTSSSFSTSQSYFLTWIAMGVGGGLTA